MRILLDAGHRLYGGDIGARGCGYKEEVETRDIVKRLYAILKREGHSVELCHNDSNANIPANQSLSDRVTRANNFGGDLYVSVHLNAFNSKAFGTEVYHYASSSVGKKYATQVHKELDSLFYGRGVKTANFYVLKNTKMPAILIEICFIDNKDDMAIYSKNKEVIAGKIASGILGKTVAIDAGVGPCSGTMYRVITGSFKETSNALNTKKIIKEKTGFDSFIISHNSKDGVMQRVVTGSFRDMENAKSRVAEIKSKSGLDSFIEAYKI